MFENTNTFVTFWYSHGGNWHYCQSKGQLVNEIGEDTARAQKRTSHFKDGEFVHQEIRSFEIQKDGSLHPTR